MLRPISKCQAEARLLRARGFPSGKSLCLGPKKKKSSHTSPEKLLPQAFLLSGSCLRLYSKSILELEAPPLPRPKVFEENLSSLVLLLRRKQIAEPGECHFLDRPGEPPSCPGGYL